MTMLENTPHWICIDVPTKKRVLHYAEGCHWSRKINDGALGPLKPVGGMGQNGGWILFPTRRDAEDFSDREFPKFTDIRFCTRCRPPAPIPDTPVSSDIDCPPAKRQSVHTYRILRDSSLARWVKLKHDNCCQICGYRITLANGQGYSEAHHIRPLGGHHQGPDIIQNILCLCPNHHVELDYFSTSLHLDNIRIHPDHPVEQQFIEYHNKHLL